MTICRQEKISLPAAELGKESALPVLNDYMGEKVLFPSQLDEDDGLFLGYGHARTIFPYHSQENYSRELKRDGLNAVILENDALRATFIPELGGRLWSLFDKTAGKELLFANSVFRPAYLALRNAWPSGGTEWNGGAYTGHHPYTCSPVFTAVLSPETSGLSSPVLRFYWFERISAVINQIDFYLPENARFLHCRIRVMNPADTVTPMYWWSNTAVKMNPRARCVVPADAAYTRLKGVVSKVPVPEWEGREITYPANSPISIDYFYKTDSSRRPYIGFLDENGYGLLQTSTARLKGRKLFVWGQGQGGSRWQTFLSGDDGHGYFNDGKYCEIQCGLANTQYECVPMPPKTAWEWIELYGPLQAEPEKIHGAWAEAQKTVETLLDAAVPRCALEQELKDTKKMAHTPADTVWVRGDGFGALQNALFASEGKKPPCPHLDFGAMGEEQRLWVSLLENGSLQPGVSEAVKTGREAPPSYQRRPEWVSRLEEAAQGKDRRFWLTFCMLGCAYLAGGDRNKAEEALRTSLSLQKNAWNLYAMAQLHRLQGKFDEAARRMAEAYALAPQDDSLCKWTARAYDEAHMWNELFTYTQGVTEEQKALPRIRMYRAIAAVHMDLLKEAEELLYEGGGLEVPDIQEGETALTELWFDLEEKKALRDGKPFDRNTARPPSVFDFRMFTTN